MAVRQELEIVAKARVEGLSQLDQLNRKIGSFRRSIMGANFVLRLFGVSLASVLGGAVIRGFIRQQEELSRSLGRTRFFLSGFEGGIERGVAFANSFAMATQQAGIATANLAREIGAKALVAFQDQAKATRVATAALLGHKLRLFDANAAINAMADASNGNTSAFRDFLRAIGIAAPEFASLETLIENFIRRSQEAQGELTEFGKAWTRLKGILAIRAAEIGAIFGEAFAPLVNVVADILKNPTEGFKRFFRQIKDGFVEAGIVIINFINKVAFDPVIQALKRARDGVREWAKAHQLAAVVIVGALSGVIALALKGYVVALLSAIKVTNLFSFTAIANAVKALGTYAITLITKAIVAVKAFVVALLIKIKTLLVANATLLVTIGIWAIAGIAVAILAFLIIKNWGKIRDFTLSAWGTIATFFNDVWQGMQDKVGSVIAFIKSEIFGVVQVVAQAISAISDLIGKIKEFISEKAKATFGFVGRAFGFGRQLGGFVKSGQSVLVGERGPELFTPTEGGQITPNRRMGGGTQITVNIIGNTLLDEDTAVKIGDMIINRVSLTHRFGLTT